MTELSDRKNLKAAANAVRTLQLQDDFPDTESQYRDSVVKQLLGRGRWSMAAEWVTDDPKQQMQACTHLFCHFINQTIWSLSSAYHEDKHCSCHAIHASTHTRGTFHIWSGKLSIHIIRVSSFVRHGFVTGRGCVDVICKVTCPQCTVVLPSLLVKDRSYVASMRVCSIEVLTGTFTGLIYVVVQVVEAIATAGEIAMAREYAEGFFGSSTVPGLDLSDEALRAAADRCAGA